MPENTFLSGQRMEAVETPIIPIVADMIKQTPGTISLGQGVVNYAPPSAALAYLKRIKMDADFHLYSPVAGLPELRSIICQKLQTENNIASARMGSIIVTAGANMGFLNALMAISDPGDEIILLKPYYFNHAMAINMLNCQAVCVETDPAYQPDIEKIRHAISGKTRAIVTVSPNNPTGAVYSEQTLRDINALCLKQGIFHISDEAYEYFTYDDSTHFSVASIESSTHHTIALYSLSKAYGFAGWRMGYMLAPAQLTTAIRKIQDTNLICPTRISQELAIIAIKAGPDYCREQLAPINRSRETCYLALQSIRDICTTPKTAGAFYFFLRLESRFSSLALTEKLIKDYKVAVIPGQAFGMENGCYLRIAFAALDKATTAMAVERLINGLSETIGRQ